MKINYIPVLKDNYIWIITDIVNNNAIVFDPGEYQPVKNFLQTNKLNLTAIMITHHHDDHVNGVNQLRLKYPKVLVFGPQETHNKGTTNIINEGDIVKLLNYKFNVIHTPGHTLGHISYYIPPYIFCGDTMFSGGCGKLIEGNAQQMYESLKKINQLPENTIIYCSHEYTLENMKFAISILPKDINIIRYYKYIKKLTLLKEITLPTKLSNERRINLFLRVQENLLLNALGIYNSSYKPWKIFSILRKKKDKFKI